MNPTPAPPDDALYLAIDQGGHASRALVFDGQGRIIASDFQPIEITHPNDSWAEHDPAQLIISLHTAISNTMHRLGERGRDVIAAGLATQRSSVVCWDKHSGAALSPVISWQDRRAHEWLQQFTEYREKIHQSTGLFLSAHYGASKLRWCLDHLPAVQAAYQNGTLACGPLASFALFHLLEKHPLLADPANASRTLLWNIKTRDWDDGLLALFGVPRAILPRCVPTRHGFGHLHAGGHTIPLTIATGDQSAALFGFGQPQPDTVYINIGTGAFMQRTTGQHYTHPRLLTSIVLQEDQQTTYTLEATINGAGSALDWASKTLGRRDTATQLAAWLTNECVPPLFLNGVSGLGAPFWMPDFTSRFIGEGEPWKKIVAVAESIVFLLYTNLTEMEATCSPAQKIIISGGLAALDGLCQRLADLSGLPVQRPAECEATVRGTAFLLVGGAAAWPGAGITINFVPTENLPLAQRFKLWREAMPPLASVLW